MAVVGLGYWGPNLVRNFSKIPKVNVLIGCDLKEKNLKNIKKDFPYLNLTTDYENVLTNKEVDLVAIATPIETHYDLARKALLYRKHVLLEKPMTKTIREGKKLIALSKRQNKLLFVEHTFVYTNALKKIKKLLEKGVLGKPYYYDSQRINLGLIQKNSNVIWDLASHDFSILNYLFKDKPISIQAFGSSHLSNPNEEMAHVFIKYPKNFIAHIHVSWLSPVKIRTVLIGGSRKMILYDDIAPSEKVRIYDKGISISPSKITPFNPAYRSGDVVIPRLEQSEALFNEVNHFIDCIRNNKKPLTGAEEGLEIVRLLEATDKSLKTKREVLLK